MTILEITRDTTEPLDPTEPTTDPITTDPDVDPGGDPFTEPNPLDPEVDPDEPDVDPDLILGSEVDPAGEGSTEESDEPDIPDPRPGWPV